MELKRVKLAELRANPANVRSEFEDIEGFAARIDAASGGTGECDEPLRVVRDANVYRIVDGERRYRAMTMLGKAEECWCCVYDDMGAAAEAVAMLAANDREQLSSGDYGRGVQMALATGVPEERVDRLTGRKGAGRAMKRAMQRNGEAAQLSIENVILADEVLDAGGSDEDYRKVLDDHVDPAYAQRRVLGEIKDRQARAELEEALAEVSESFGLEIADRKPKGAPLRKGIYRLGADEVREQGPTWAAAQCTLVRPRESWCAWELYDQPAEMSEEEQQAVATKNAMRRIRTAGEKRRAEWLHAQMVSRGGRLPAGVQRLTERYYDDNRSYEVHAFCERAGADDGDVPLIATAWMTAMAWPSIDHMTNDECDCITACEGWALEHAAKRHVDVMRAFERDGYEPDEDEKDFLSACEHALAVAKKQEAGK